MSCCREIWDECGEFPNISLHLTVEYLEKVVNAGHLCDERFGMLIRSTALASIHPLEGKLVPLVNEVKREVEFTVLELGVHYYDQVAHIMIRCSHCSFSGMEGQKGYPLSLFCGLRIELIQRGTERNNLSNAYSRD